VINSIGYTRLPEGHRRFFISSLPANAKQIASAVRAHWLVENALHWTLDVVFNEDNSRVRKKNAGHNMALIRHIVFNKKLIIEVDGGQHIEAGEYDKRRTEFLEKKGYRVLRVWNNEVFNNTRGVLETILTLLESVPA